MQVASAFALGCCKPSYALQFTPTGVQDSAESDTDVQDCCLHLAIAVLLMALSAYVS